MALKRHKDGVSSLSYSPDGFMLASGSWDSTIKLWDSKTGQLKQTLKGHEGSVYALSYNNDGTLTSFGDDGIKQWTPAILKTQDLFYKYDPYQVSVTLQFLWEMNLDDDLTFFIHRLKPLMLSPIQGRYYDNTQFLPLLAYPPEGKTKADQLIQWLEDNKAYKKEWLEENKMSQTR